MYGIPSSFLPKALIEHLLSAKSWEYSSTPKLLNDIPKLLIPKLLMMGHNIADL